MNVEPSPPQGQVINIELSLLQQHELRIKNCALSRKEYTTQEDKLCVVLPQLYISLILTAQLCQTLHFIIYKGHLGGHL